MRVLEIDARSVSWLVVCAAVVFILGCPSHRDDAGTTSSGAENEYGFSPDSELQQVAILVNGPKSDWGYNYAHGLGQQRIAQAYGDRVFSAVIESVPETADAERVMERLVDAGVDMIIAGSFGYQDATIAVAERHQDVRFLQAWGFEYRDNVATYSAKMYEVWYLMGMVAGEMTESNKLGIVAAHPVPPMFWQINAYVLGARSVNPDVTATVTFINHWFDPVLAAQATEALINQGHDVVTGVLDSSVAVAQTAERMDTWLIAHNADLSEFAPTRQLVGTRWLWGNLYVDQVGEMLDGSWEGGEDQSGGLGDGYVGLTGFSPSVPGPVQQRVREAQAAIEAGRLQVYAGPIAGQAGATRVEAGAALDHGQVMGIDWLVQGVQ